MPSGLSSRRLKRPLLQQAGSKPLNELRARVHPGRVITRCPFALLIAEFLRHVWCWHSRKSKSSSSPGTYRPAHPHPNTAPTPQSHGTQQNSAAWPASQQDHSKPSCTQKASLFQVGFGGFSGPSCALCTVTASGVGWKTKRLSRSWRNLKHLEKPKGWARFLHGQQILTLFLLCLLSLSSSSPPLPSMDSSIHPSPAVCPTQPQTMFVVTISLLISATARVTRLQPLSTGEPPGRARRQPSLQC